MRWSRANDRFSLAGDFRHAHPSKSGDSPGIRAGVLPPVCGLRVGGFYNERKHVAMPKTARQVFTDNLNPVGIGGGLV